jgi:ABC-2 type transport system ATP-binding protein
MTSDALRVRDLQKLGAGIGVTVLDGMSFTVPRGSICGMVGPNGAGKSTTLRVVMGLVFAKGSIEILGAPAPMSRATKQRVAFVPEARTLYPFAKAGEMIRLTRSFYPTWDAALERRLVDDFAIPLDQQCKRLSKGMLARLWLVLVLCRNADLLMLDEASDGLDPVALDLLQRTLIQQVADRGATVLFSTHQLADVEQIADRVVIVDRGRCVMEGAIDDLRQRYRVVRCALDDELEPAPAALASWRRDGRFLTGLSGDDPSVLADALTHAGARVVDAQPASLKDLFLAQVGRLA